ncbi:MAG: molybdopterin-dependent oxidoreductase [Candidatus Methanofastidiosia archaeon]
MRKGWLFLLSIMLLILFGACISDGKTQWDIKIYGEVEKEFFISYGDMEEMPQTYILENVVDGTVSYSGVGIGHIMALAGPLPGVDRVNFIAEDGYILSFSLGDVVDGILALRREGKKLDKDIGPVMLALNVGCKCNWMKKVSQIEFFSTSNALGIVGDVTNPLYLTFEDMAVFTGRENFFTVGELFAKVAYYPQSQRFCIKQDVEEAHYFSISLIDESIVTYSNGSFNVEMDGKLYEDVKLIECVWDPNT